MKNPKRKRRNPAANDKNPFYFRPFTPKQLNQLVGGFISLLSNFNDTESLRLAMAEFVDSDDVWSMIDRSKAPLRQAVKEIAAEQLRANVSRHIADLDERDQADQAKPQLFAQPRTKDPGPQ